MPNARQPGARPDRRAVLGSTLAFGSAMVAGVRPGLGQGAAPLLKVESRILEVDRKPAKVFHVTGAGGRSGLLAAEGDRFRGALLNASPEPLQLHWHGQTKAPFDQDRARPGGGTLAVGASDHHDFELTPGTHWMHSHTLSEQQLLAAPMVTRERDAGDAADVVIMLHDFAFRSPQEILAELGGSDSHGGHGGSGAGAAPSRGSGSGSGSGAGSGSGSGSGARAGSGSGSGHMGHGGGQGPMMGMAHANDVRYDAYLANDRTLADPEVVRVEKGGRVRLRIINGGTATAFVVTTPGLRSDCIAVDGTPCVPVSAASYPIAQGQRLDLLVTIPSAGGAFPVLAQVEAAQVLTGIVLATAGAQVSRIGATANAAAPMLDLGFEARLRAVAPLAARRADQSFMLMLSEEPGYRWTINGRVHGEHRPLAVALGERVELSFMNPTGMMHPMHLHGHHFQVVAIGGQRFPGALRDTVIVPPHTPVTVAFDAAQKGEWFLHCHHLYHMATGMMTEVRIA